MGGVNACPLSSAAAIGSAARNASIGPVLPRRWRRLRASPKSCPCAWQPQCARRYGRHFAINNAPFSPQMTLPFRVAPVSPTPVFRTWPPEAFQVPPHWMLPCSFARMRFNPQLHLPRVRIRCRHHQPHNRHRLDHLWSNPQPPLQNYRLRRSQPECLLREPERRRFQRDYSQRHQCRVACHQRCAVSHHVRLQQPPGPSLQHPKFYRRHHGCYLSSLHQPQRQWRCRVRQQQ